MVDTTMAAPQPTTVLKYLDLRPLGPFGGRGACVRLYMLVNKMDFQEELVSLSDWEATEKARCPETLNPAGTLPVLTIGGRSYAEHVSICRYLSRRNGEYGMDPEMDFIADAAADVYSDWRNQWASLLSLENADGAAMAYLDNRNKYYNTLEWYYSKKSSPGSPFLTGGSRPGFVDVIVFNMIRDDSLMHAAVNLAAYPNLKAMFEAVGSNTEVEAWARRWVAQTLAAVANA